MHRRTREKRLPEYLTRKIWYFYLFYYRLEKNSVVKSQDWLKQRSTIQKISVGPTKVDLNRLDIYLRQIYFRLTLLIKYFVRIGLVLGHMMADETAFYLGSRNSHYTSFSSKDPPLAPPFKRNLLDLYQIRKGSRVADLVQGV